MKFVKMKYFCYFISKYVKNVIFDAELIKLLCYAIKSGDHYLEFSREILFLKKKKKTKTFLYSDPYNFVTLILTFVDVNYLTERVESSLYFSNIVKLSKGFLKSYKDFTEKLCKTLTNPFKHSWLTKFKFVNNFKKSSKIIK